MRNKFIKSLNCSGCDTCINEYNNASGPFCLFPNSKNCQRKQENFQANLDAQNKQTETISELANTSGVVSDTGNSTLLYIGIGVGALILIGTLIWALKK